MHEPVITSKNLTWWSLLCTSHHFEEPHSGEQVGWGPRLVITSNNLTLTQFFFNYLVISSLLLSYLALHSQFQCSIKTFNWLNISELTPPGFPSCSHFYSEIGFFPFIFESLSCFPSLRGVHSININMTWETLSHIKRLRSENSALNRQLTWLDMIWFLPMLFFWWMDLKWKTEVFLIINKRNSFKC